MNDLNSVLIEGTVCGLLITDNVVLIGSVMGDDTYYFQVAVRRQDVCMPKINDNVRVVGYLKEEDGVAIIEAEHLEIRQPV